jgi:hypothetical protein
MCEEEEEWWPKLLEARNKFVKIISRYEILDDSESSEESDIGGRELDSDLDPGSEAEDKVNEDFEKKRGNEEKRSVKKRRTKKDGKVKVTTPKTKVSTQVARSKPTKEKKSSTIVKADTKENKKNARQEQKMSANVGKTKGKHRKTKYAPPQDFVPSKKRKLSSSTLAVLPAKVQKKARLANTPTTEHKQAGVTAKQAVKVAKHTIKQQTKKQTPSLKLPKVTIEADEERSFDPPSPLDDYPSSSPSSWSSSCDKWSSSSWSSFSS